MKKLTPDEVKNQNTIPDGYGSPVRKVLLTLKVEEGLIITRSEWKWKRQGPNMLCNRINKKGGPQFKCSKLADGSGWMMVREK